MPAHGFEDTHYIIVGVQGSPSALTVCSISTGKALKRKDGRVLMVDHNGKRRWIQTQALVPSSSDGDLPGPSAGPPSRPISRSRTRVTTVLAVTWPALLLGAWCLYLSAMLSLRSTSSTGDWHRRLTADRHLTSTSVWLTQAQRTVEMWWGSVTTPIGTRGVGS
jgi:hypothetical protein